MSINARSPQTRCSARSWPVRWAASAFEAIPALISLLGDDTPIRLIKYLDEWRLESARHKFKQASPGEQAAIALAALRSQPAVEPLIAALNNGNPSVRETPPGRLARLGEVW